MRSSIAAIVCILCLAACGSSGDSSSGSNGGRPGDSSVGGPVAGGTCGTDKLCIDVAPTTSAQAFRLAVYWYQLDDDGPDPIPQVTFDKNVPAGTTRIEILLTDIPAPTDEKVFYCERSSTDEAASPCTNNPQVAYGMVYAYRDNGDNVLVPTKESKDTTVGFANVIMGYTANGYPRGTAPSRTADWDRLWPDGTQQGMHIYQIGKPDNSFDRPIRSPSGTNNALVEKAPNVT